MISNGKCNTCMPSISKHYDSDHGTKNRLINDWNLTTENNKACATEELNNNRIIRTIQNNKIREDMSINQEETDNEASQLESKNKRRIKFGEIRIRWGVEDEKRKGVTRLFSVNFNGLGPDSIRLDN